MDGKSKLRTVEDLVRPVDARTSVGRLHREILAGYLEELGGEHRLTLRKKIAASQCALIELALVSTAGKCGDDVSIATREDTLQLMRIWRGLQRELGLVGRRGAANGRDELAEYLTANGYCLPGEAPDFNARDADDTDFDEPAADDPPRRRRVRLADADEDDIEDDE